MGRIRHYRDLDVWQRGMDVTVMVYRFTDLFPKSEVYGLTNQIRRAAVAISSNIAEGYGRSNKEFGRFLSIARGSLAELETQLEIARRIQYLSEENFEALNAEITILGKQLNVLSQKVNARM
ncbi:MAG: four helix bundle protein [Ardenticatenaceae bacterium]|nr:four helix bundle protein [Ardenticatenaceae bacterium]MCB9445627.1 four helix bundle protein [Ardenticatenaceae bacterium]